LRIINSGDYLRRHFAISPPTVGSETERRLFSQLPNDNI